MSLLLRLQGPPPAFQPEEDYWFQLHRALAPQLAPLFAADEDFAPPAALDEDLWLDLRPRLQASLPWVATADDETVPQPATPAEDYWLQLLARPDFKLAWAFSSDDEIVPQPAVFVPDEEYGPRLVLVDDAYFVQLWGSDDSASAPAPAAFVPEEEYWQRVMLFDEPQFGQVWGSDGAASSAAAPPRKREWRRKQSWHRTSS